MYRTNKQLEQVDAEPKNETHVSRISRAVDRLAEVEQSLFALLDELRGTPTKPATTENDEAQIPLEQCLLNTPDILHRRADNMAEAIAEIRKVLRVY